MSGITFIRRDQNDGVNIVRIIAENTLSQVGASGYLTAQASNIAALNNATVDSPFDWEVQDMALVYASDGWGFFTVSSDFTRLNAFSMSPTVIGTPVTVGNFAIFQSTSGNLEDLGYLPSNAAKTRVVMAGGAVVANHIALFQDTTGTIDDAAATAINNGPIQAGLSGTSGYLESFPTTASKGSLRLVAADNAGDTVTQITNASFGQATVITIPDPADATADMVISPSALTNNNLVKASGTAGLIVDAGIAASNVQLKTDIKAGTTADIGGAGAGPITVAVAGLTAASVVVATVESSSNPVSVIACTAGVGSFDITFSADPGASCLVNFVAFIAAQ